MNNIQHESIGHGTIAQLGPILQQCLETNDYAV